MTQRVEKAEKKGLGEVGKPGKEVSVACWGVC